MLTLNSFSVLLALVSAQTGAQTDAPKSLLAGTSTTFQKHFKSASQALAQKNYAKASALTTNLPKTQVNLLWNDKLVAESNRKDYIGVRDRAIALWQSKFPEMKFAWVKANPDITIGFSAKLPSDPGSILPAGAKFVSSTDPKLPSINATIALQRGAPLLDIGPREIFNEINFALASYFGLAKIPPSAQVNSRVDVTYGTLSGFGGSQISVINDNLRWTKALREAISAKKSLAIGWPKISMDLQKVTSLKGVQGDILKFSIAISNQGDAPMTLFAIPDCGCFRLPVPTKIAPGQTEIYRASVDTSEFKGTHDKVLTMYTNDPDRSTFEFPVRFSAAPRYDFIAPSKDNLYQMPENGLTLKVQLDINKTKPFKVLNASLSGGSGVIDWADWKNEAGTKSGQEFSILLSPDIGPGRELFSVEVETSDPILQFIRYTFQVQKGLAVMPANIYFGNIPRKSVTANSILSDPHRPFKILGIKTDSSFLKAKIEPISKNNTEYRITASIINPKDAGVYEGNIIVTTDYPGQETIVVPVLAKVPD